MTISKSRCSGHSHSRCLEVGSLSMRVRQVDYKSTAGLRQTPCFLKLHEDLLKLCFSDSLTGAILCIYVLVLVDQQCLRTI